MNLKVEQDLGVVLASKWTCGRLHEDYSLCNLSVIGIWIDFILTLPSDKAECPDSYIQTSRKRKKAQRPRTKQDRAMFSVSNATHSRSLLQIWSHLGIWGTLERSASSNWSERKDVKNDHLVYGSNKSQDLGKTPFQAWFQLQMPRTHAEFSKYDLI